MQSASNRNIFAAIIRDQLGPLEFAPNCPHGARGPCGCCPSSMHIALNYLEHVGIREVVILVLGRRKDKNL